ncbi:unnamed protein product [Hyaloperonospora brassicae]|uniref:Inositol oxygenase n=1 Tax=Hyaloperonospora brassicae TaxID=162125 RepID=A0AAV0T877_HYABA|nr:unnamed protein product [Hyaloperonospora brassicae]
MSLGACASVFDVWTGSATRFRLQFVDDRRTKELRWVLFASSQRGAVGKLIFTLEKSATAHVKSLTVDPAFRGVGLARVLYLATLATLEKCHVQVLYLEAEEDSNRYGKLVGLYQGWGFTELPDSNVLYLYNGNECLRKVPMVSVFQPDAFVPLRSSESDWFVMLTLETSDGTCLMAQDNGDIVTGSSKKPNTCMWQTMFSAFGDICLRSVYGKFLCVEETGRIVADRRVNSTWETFQVVPQHGEEAGGVALRSFHGSYLGIEPVSKQVQVSDDPVPWDGGDMMSLVCNKMDPHPLFVKIMRKYQTTAFVNSQVAKYGHLQHAQMSVLEACKFVMALTGDMDRGASWVIKYMVATASAVKEDGHPDWLQLAVFLRALGMVFLCWTDEDNIALRSVSAQEWLTKNSAWVVGEAIPRSIAFPELNKLNVDHCKAEKAGRSATRQCGLASVTLPWTPDEYLYCVLSHNRTTLPAEALDVVRYWSFRTWHEQDNYSELCTPQDMDTKEWISSLGKVAAVSEHTVQNCDVNSALHYCLQLAEKYLPETLRW